MFFNNTMYVVVFFTYFYFFPFFLPGCCYSARIVCIEHIISMSIVCVCVSVTLCEELNDDDDDNGESHNGKSMPS